jgi:hypothetical protein
MKSQYSNLASLVRSSLVITSIVALLFVGTDTASARLGTFSANDGYQHIISPPGTSGYNFSDVTYYNAGAYGANAGGGSGPTFIAPDSGQWRLVSGVGGFFNNAAARSAALLGSPPYPFAYPGTTPSYMVGAHFPGHNNDGHNLAFRNDTPVGTGPSIYEYSLDQYDMGVAPSTVTSGTVGTQFYFLPTVAVPNNTGGKPVDKFTMSFVDSVGNVGLQWGYARDNEVVWRDSSSNNWNYSGIYAADQSSNQWDAVKVEIDLSSDTFKLDYYDLSAAAWVNLAAAGTALGQSMTDFTVLRWQLEDDTSTPFAGKNYFDDFSISVVPEPSTIVLGLMSAVVFGTVALRRRKK